MTKATVGGDCRPLTTFVRTDINTFREIVQRLTGPTDQAANAPASPKQGVGATGFAKSAGMKRPTVVSGMSSILDRRQYNRNRPKLQIVKPPTRAKSTGSFSVDLHSLTPSPGLTPTSNFSKLSLTLDNDEPAPPLILLNRKEEEKAIKERRFYLHQSPRSRTQTSQPELLNLFPLTSPR